VATILSQLLVRVRKHTDDYSFVGTSLLVLGTVFLGFARSYYLAGTFHARLQVALGEGAGAHGPVLCGLEPEIRMPRNHSLIKLSML
jgi:hypothetical protein